MSAVSDRVIRDVVHGLSEMGLILYYDILDHRVYEGKASLLEIVQHKAAKEELRLRGLLDRRAD